MANDYTLDILQLWRSGQTLYKSQLDSACSSIETFAFNGVTNDKNQLRMDLFGSAYTFDQDGVNNLSYPLYDISNNTSRLNWKFTGTVTLPSSITIDQTSFDYTVSFANPAAARTITFTDPLGNDSVAYLNATQSFTNKTFSDLLTVKSLTGNAVIDINAFTNFNPIINFKENNGTKWSQYNDNTSDNYTVLSSLGNYMQIGQDASLTIKRITASGSIALTIDSGLNGNPMLYFNENGVQKWWIFNNNANDNLRILNASSSPRLEIGQTGGLLVNSDTDNDPFVGLYENSTIKWKIINNHTTDFLGFHGPSDNKILEITSDGIDVSNPTDDTEINIESITDKDGHIKFIENTVTKWDMYHDHDNDYFNITNDFIGPVFSNQLSLHPSGGMSSDCPDPPIANFYGSQSAARAWLNYVDNSGDVTNSFNIQAVSSDDGDGRYSVAIDTDNSNEYPAIAGSCPGDKVVTVLSSTTALLTIDIYDISSHALSDANFSLIMFSVGQ